MKERATIICMRAGDVLLVSKEGARWALPGGRIEFKETPVEAARRELLEETSLLAHDMRYLFEFHGLRTRHHVFAAEPRGFDARAGNEIAQCRWTPPADIDTLTVSVSTREIIALATQTR
jgi:8-oxo-dGTP diphosphatase